MKLINFQTRTLSEDISSELLILQSRLAQLNQRKSQVTLPIEQEIGRLQKLIAAKQLQLKNQRTPQTPTIPTDINQTNS